MQVPPFERFLKRDSYDKQRSQSPEIGLTAYRDTGSTVNIIANKCSRDKCELLSYCIDTVLIYL